MYRWTSHTGEEQLEIEADSPSAVLAEAAAAFGSAIELEPGGDAVIHECRLTGTDLSEVLVELLQELIYLADTEGFVPEHAELAVRGSDVVGAISGRRTAVRELVKAATYAGLRFEQADGKWLARVVLDV